MDCREVERLLEDSMKGPLSESDQADLADHLEMCPSCRRYRSILEGGTDLLAGHEQECFLRDVLKRTSGPACVQAGELLCLDPGETSPQEQRLLAAHLEFCPRCTALKAWLQEGELVLPSLAEIDPGAGFTSSVLRVTSHAPAPAPSWFSNLGRSIGRLLQRPRFSWEAAYAGTLLLVALFGNPAEYLRPAGETDRTAGIAPAQVTRLAGTIRTGFEERYEASVARISLAEDAFRALSQRSSALVETCREMAERAELALRQRARSSLQSLPLGGDASRERKEQEAPPNL
jgi:hypothetical protein